MADETEEAIIEDLDQPASIKANNQPISRRNPSLGSALKNLDEGIAALKSSIKPAEPPTSQR